MRILRWLIPSRVRDGYSNVVAEWEERQRQATDITQVPLAWIKRRTFWQAHLIAVVFGSLLAYFIRSSLNAFSREHINVVETLLAFVVAPITLLIVSTVAGVTFKSQLEKYKPWLRMLPFVGIGYGTWTFISAFSMFLMQHITPTFSTTFHELINAHTIGIFLDITSAPLQVLGLDFDPTRMANQLVENNMPSGTIIMWRNYVLAAILVYAVLTRILWVVTSYAIEGMESSLSSRKPTFPFNLPLESSGSTSPELEDYFELTDEELRLFGSLEYHLLRDQWSDNSDSKNIPFGQAYWDNEMVECDSQVLKAELKRLSQSRYRQKLMTILFSQALIPPDTVLSLPEGTEEYTVDAEQWQTSIRSVWSDSGLPEDTLNEAFLSYQQKIKDSALSERWWETNTARRLAVLIPIGAVTGAVLSVAPFDPTGLVWAYGVRELTAIALCSGDEEEPASSATGKTITKRLLCGGALLNFDRDKDLPKEPFLGKNSYDYLRRELAVVEVVATDILKQQEAGLDNEMGNLLERITYAKGAFERELKTLETTDDDSVTEQVSKSDLTKSINLLGERIRAYSAS